MCFFFLEVSPPYSVAASDVGQKNMTVCWEPLEDDNVDGYCIQLWRSTGQTQPHEFWQNSSDCMTLVMLVPGETYEVGVAAVKGGNRSKERTIQQTLSKNKHIIPIFMLFLILHFPVCNFYNCVRVYA